MFTTGRRTKFRASTETGKKFSSPSATWLQEFENCQRVRDLLRFAFGGLRAVVASAGNQRWPPWEMTRKSMNTCRQLWQLPAHQSEKMRRELQKGSNCRLPASVKLWTSRLLGETGCEKGRCGPLELLAFEAPNRLRLTIKQRSRIIASLVLASDVSACPVSKILLNPNAERLHQPSFSMATHASGAHGLVDRFDQVPSIRPADLAQLALRMAKHGKAFAKELPKNFCQL